MYDASGVLIAEYSGEVAAEPRVSYLTTDHLGSPRVTTNERGVVVNRRDFMAFGEEAISVQRLGGGSGNGYEAAGATRKDYTGYEKDEESGLEFAQARYYNSSHGRFTSVDPLVASATIRNPQTFNRYSYGLNSPYKFTDPLGLLSQYTTGACGGRCPNSGPSSGMTGRDSSFDWAFDWYGEVGGYELDQPDGSKVVNGKVVPPPVDPPPPQVGVIFQAGEIWPFDKQENTVYYDLPPAIQKISAPPYWRRDFVFNLAFRLDDLATGATFTDYTFEVEYGDGKTVEGTKTEGEQTADKRSIDQLVATYVVYSDRYGEGAIGSDGRDKIPAVSVPEDRGVEISGSINVFAKGWVARSRFTVSVKGSNAKATPYKLTPLVWERVGK